MTMPIPLPPDLASTDDERVRAALRELGAEARSAPAAELAAITERIRPLVERHGPRLRRAVTDLVDVLPASLAEGVLAALAADHDPHARSDAHTLLVVEGDAAIALVLEEICGSLGYLARRAATLVEVRRALDVGGFCGVLLDPHIPADEHARAQLGAGETALALLRKRDRRRNAEGFHTLPIVAITEPSVAPDFVARLFKAGVDEFIPKSLNDAAAPSFADRLDAVLDKIRACLAQAGRAEHASCAPLDAVSPTSALPSPNPLVAPQPPPQRAGSMVIELRGDVVARRSVVLVNGEPRELQGRLFAVLVHLALEHERDPAAWCTHHELSIARTPDVTKRLRDALNPALPDGLDVLDTKYGGHCRLNPEVTVLLDRARLADHPDARVAKLIADRGRAPSAGRGR